MAQVLGSQQVSGNLKVYINLVMLVDTLIMLKKKEQKEEIEELSHLYMQGCGVWV